MPFITFHIRKWDKSIFGTSDCDCLNKKKGTQSSITAFYCAKYAALNIADNHCHQWAFAMELSSKRPETLRLFSLRHLPWLVKLGNQFL